MRAREEGVEVQERTLDVRWTLAMSVFLSSFEGQRMHTCQPESDLPFSVG